MTGEMSRINPRTGEDSNGESWPVHLAIARSVKGELRPFDVYQGPYIRIPGGRLWLSFDGFTASVFHDGTRRAVDYWPVNNTRRACRAARELLKGGGYSVDAPVA